MYDRSSKSSSYIGAASRKRADSSDDITDGSDDDHALEQLEAELDDELDLGGFRERRLNELKAQ